MFLLRTHQRYKNLIYIIYIPILFYFFLISLSLIKTKCKKTVLAILSSGE